MANLKLLENPPVLFDVVSDSRENREQRASLCQNSGFEILSLTETNSP